MRLCAERAASASSAPAGSSGVSRGFGVAANGKVIEQSQILTTHNLATLVHRVGIAPSRAGPNCPAALSAPCAWLTARVHHDARPYSTIKDAAYAWRQSVFHLALCPAAEQRGVLADLGAETARHPAHVAARLAPALAGLRLVVAGGAFDPDGTADGGRARRLLGWTTDGHWLAADPTAVESGGS